MFISVFSSYHFNLELSRVSVFICMPVSLNSYIEAVEVWWELVVQVSFLLKRHQPREQSFLNPAWCEATYRWLTDNCPLTRDLLILKNLTYIIILPTAILPIKYWVSAQYLWKVNKLKLNKYSSAYITKNCQKTRMMAGQETGRPHTYRSAGGSSHAVITP